MTRDNLLYALPFILPQPLVLQHSPVLQYSLVVQILSCTSKQLSYSSMVVFRYLVLLSCHCRRCFHAWRHLLTTLLTDPRTSMQPSGYFFLYFFSGCIFIRVTPSEDGEEVGGVERWACPLPNPWLATSVGTVNKPNPRAASAHLLDSSLLFTPSSRTGPSLLDSFLLFTTSSQTAPHRTTTMAMALLEKVSMSFSLC
jgi:hypothetical protein